MAKKTATPRVPIKFRGQVVPGDKEDGGRLVYGSLVVYTTGPHTHWIFSGGTERNYPVKPASVAQLVGYDADNKEVYEGDIISMEYNGLTYDYKARLEHSAATADGCWCALSQFKDRRLKG